jgi:hypothetical protein
MKTILGIISGVFIGCMLAFSALAVFRFSGPFQASQEELSGKPEVSSPGPSISISPLPLEISANEYPSSPVSPLPVPLSSAVSQPAPAETKKVDFGLAISGVSGSGLARKVSARITNTGTSDAHNTSLKVEAYSQGSRVKLGGKEYILQNLGTLKAGESQPVEADISFNITEGPRILKDGADFVITISSNEKILSLNYNYKP